MQDFYMTLGGIVEGLLSESEYKRNHPVIQTNSTEKTIVIFVRGWAVFAEEVLLAFEKWCENIELSDGEYINVRYLQDFLTGDYFPLDKLPEGWHINHKTNIERSRIGKALLRFKKFNFEFDYTDSYPRVVGNYKEGTLLFEGRILTECVWSDTEPVMMWIYNFISNENRVFTLSFKLTYYHESGGEMIFKLLKYIKTQIGDLLQVIWFYHEDDEDMEEVGEEFQKLIGHKFIFRSHE